MSRDRLIQLFSGFLLVCSVSFAGTMLPSILERSEAHKLRYTDVSVEGAPPIVALGTAIGAFRGIIADYLWIKVNIMKQKGLFYEIMADTELITKLQPRFSEVWAFHGHNMAYNISVVTETEEERWKWVNQGIDLVRNQGLRYNPNDLILHKELAFWFSHKIEGVADDAHLYYKKQLAHRWHLLLGEPPYQLEERIAWIKEIADAPETLEEAERRTPGVKALVEKLRNEVDKYNEELSFKLNEEFLTSYGLWKAVGRSPYAQILGVHETHLANNERYRAFDTIGPDPELQEQWDTLLAYNRKKVLQSEYNMSPQLMYEYTRDFGPLDWRHGQAHAFYWSRRARDFAEHRIWNEEDIYKIVNNDAITIQAMQALSRSGTIGFDPFSPDLPSRLPDHRWVMTIHEYFLDLYNKHYETRGAGGDRFVDFHQNFMSSAVRELYRAGDLESARNILDKLNELYGLGTGRGLQNPEFALPLDEFVRERTFGEYEMQPSVAINDVYNSLRRGFQEGLLLNRPEVFKDSLDFARSVTAYFKGNRYNDFINKFGKGRMKSLIGNLQSSVQAVFRQLMLDNSLPLYDRLFMWNNAPESIRRQVYDDVRPVIAEEFAANPISQRRTLAQMFPEPSGMEQYRQMLAQQRAAQAEAQRQNERAETENR